MLTRTSTLISFFSFTLSAALPLTSACKAGDVKELAIDNSPQNIVDGQIKAQMRGVRVVTTSAKFVESSPNGVTVPKEVVVDAVKGSVELRKALNLWSENSNDLTFSKIATAARDVEGKDIYWKSDNRSIAGVLCGIPQASTKERLWQDLSCDSSSNYNSEAVAQLLVRGGLETDKDVQAEVNGKSVDLVAVRPTYASTLIAGR